LDINGIEIPEATGTLFDAMIAITEHKLDKDGLARVLRQLGGPR
jgi:hypothetical protein